MSLRDQILATDDIQSELLDVPEWDVTVEVRGMNGADRARIIERASSEGGIGAGSMYAETVVMSCYDPETGERVFSDGDLDALMGKSASAIDRIAIVAMRLSGMDQEAQDEAGRQFPEEPAS